MQKVIGICLLLALPAQAYATDLSVGSKVDAVTVFMSGAEITRLAKVKLEKGEHAITVIDIPASAIESSIRVTGNATGKLDIASVNTRRRYLSRQDAQATGQERKTLEDQIEALRDQKSIADAQITAAETQRSLIANLSQLPARPAPATAAGLGEDWQRILGIISQGSNDAARASVEAQGKVRALERQIEDLEKKLSMLAPEQTEQTEVKVHVSSASPLEADLIIRYQIAQASWTPLYDVRLATGSKTVPATMELARRATIAQQSGEDWTDAQLQLSTTRPSGGSAAPELETQTVDFEPELRPITKSKAALARKASELAARDGADMATEMVVAEAPPPPVAAPIGQQQTEITQAPFEATFVVSGRVSILGTGEVKSVVLTTETGEPQLFCRTVPKVDPKAFLYARMSFAKGTPLLPGQAYLFRDGTFVGTGDIPLLNPGESHDLGFGIDDQVKVRYAILEEKRGETGLISSSQTDVRNYRVTVKNMHERPIMLEMIDQIPVALNQEIKVDFLGKVQPTKTNIDDKRGMMLYEAKLEPDEEKVFDYGYRIAWPTEKRVMYGR